MKLLPTKLYCDTTSYPYVEKINMLSGRLVGKGLRAYKYCVIAFPQKSEKMFFEAPFSGLTFFVESFLLIFATSNKSVKGKRFQ